MSHTGSYTMETGIRVEREVVTNLLNALKEVQEK
jgi:hypothetical protein